MPKDKNVYFKFILLTKFNPVMQVALNYVPKLKAI